MRLRRVRCWYCRRVGRFGWKKGRQPWQSPECKNDRACFARVGYRDYVRTLRATLARCPLCGNAPHDGPGIVITGGDALSGPLGDPCDGDFHPENGFVVWP